MALNWQTQPTWRIRDITVTPDKQTVNVQAHAEGLTAFLLRLMGIPTTASLQADPSGVYVTTSRFSGTTRTFCPRSHIATSILVDAKPVELLIAGLLLLPLFFIGVLLWIAYIFAKRRIVLGVGTSAGTVESLKLKASSVERDQLSSAASVIESLIQGSAAASAGAAPPGMPATRSPSTPPPTPRGSTIVCDGCGKQLSIPPGTPSGKRFSCPGCGGVVQV
jgi:hypothetical protein